jgi:ankyrin repeat protein
LLWNAVIRQETGVLRFCFAGGMRVKPGSGLLLRAAYLGNVEVARLLLAHGADLHETDTEGNMAVHQAASEGRRDLMDLLIREGASLTTKNKEGRTAVDVARVAGYVEWADEWERKPATK